MGSPPQGTSLCRWPEDGWDAIAKAGRVFNTLLAKDVWGRPVLLFKNAYALEQVQNSETGEKLGYLSPYALPPEF
jgi:peptide chain release factor 3